MHELAEHLRAERLKQGRTVEFISEKTRISTGMIHALESGEFDRIGIPLIIRSFIRSYCEALGLESAPLIEKYEHHIGAYDSQGTGFLRYGQWCRSLRRQGRSKVLLILILVLLAVGTLIGGAWFSVWLKHQQSAEKTSGVYPSQELPLDLIRPQGGALASVDGLGAAEMPAARESGIQTGGAGTGSAVGLSGADALGQTGPPSRGAAQPPSAGEVLPADADEAATRDGRKHMLSLEAVRKTRVRLRIDDRRMESITLMPGDRREFEVMHVAELHLRDAKALRIEWDREAVGGSGPRMRFPSKTGEEGNSR